ncbi:MAG TPA: SUMF1/EgtB/PvdO family nonheme iron enzyme [Gemmataceae bacterium]|nr:SUMF1/EgtB/PvdO family nonheme iron enzyme [Gemmataceae bacterium]
MAIIVQCPNPACRQSCSVAESLSGQPVRCAKCGKPFLVKPTIDGQKSGTNKPQPSANANPFPVLPAEFGRYRVLRLLGKGGMGAVYLAQDSQLGRQVALKIPFFDASESSLRIERFVREGRSAAALHHPNICKIFDAGKIDGRPFLTMAYLAGTPLEDDIDPDVPMPQVRAAEIVRKIAVALEHAHRKGIVHRDLKPANIMMAADDGEPVVMDFGLAKRVVGGNAQEAKLTRAGGIVGTPSYMSPEQVKEDAQAIGPATDIYSLGVMLFEMLTGKTPYCGSLGVVLGQILAAPVPPVQEFRPDVDSRLDAICRKAMAKEPADRFASMAEFANALGQYLDAPQSSPPSLLVPQTLALTVDHSPLGRLVEATAPTPAAKKAKTWRAVALALTLLVPLSIWLAVVLLRVETANGTLTVEMNDDEVEARIKNGKLILSGPDGKVRYTLTAKDRSKQLEAGPYKIRVEGADGLVLDASEFTIKKGGQVKVRVTLERKAMVKKDSPGNPVVPKKGEGITNSIGMKLAYIPQGSFIMGSPANEVDRLDAEGPEHEVEITKGFYMGVYEVTQDQYAGVMGKNPSYFTSTGIFKDKVKDMDTRQFPVENVSWNDAGEFCWRLSQLPKEKANKRVYRLPTEAEWEYVCRGGPFFKKPSPPFYFGNSLSPTQANFNGNFPYGGAAKGTCLDRTTKVGSYSPNPLGVYDLHGNVWEWCADWFDAEYYKRSPRQDPQGPENGVCRVLRGGAWDNFGRICRAAFRHNCMPGVRRNCAFRVVLVPGARN